MRRLAPPTERPPASPERPPVATTFEEAASACGDFSAATADPAVPATAVVVASPAMIAIVAFFNV
jgi:hypothetical protein